MKVVAIIITYNSILWIKKCLSSLAASTKKLDVIVVDNASSDNTVNFIETNYPNVRVVKNKTNEGFAAANNTGIKLADTLFLADHFFLLNHDAWIRKDTIEKLVKLSLKFPEYGVLSPIHLNATNQQLEYLFTSFISKSNDEGRNLYSDLILKQPLQEIYDIHFVNAAAWLISRRAIKTVGLFDSINFPHYGEDNNYLQRVRYFNLKIGVVPSTFITHDTESRAGKHNSKNFQSHLELKKFKVSLLDLTKTSSLDDLKYELKLGLESSIKSLIKLNFTELKSRISIYKEKRKLVNCETSIKEKYKKEGFDPEV